MKKSLVLLFFFLFLSCSNDSFDSQIAATAQKTVYCQVEGKGCIKISKSLCAEIGGTEKCTTPSDGSSSSEEISDMSSSSGNAVSSSSVGNSSSISSSSNATVKSSSSAGTVSSSSTIVDVSSSSSNDSVSSSSSADISSSSSLTPPTLSDCSSFPYYVAKTKKEYIGDLVTLEGNTNGCEKITYTLSGSSSISITGDSISFTSASSVPSSSSERSLTIKASVSCGGTQPLTKDCPIKVVVADKFAEMKSCVSGEADKISIGSGSTIFEVSCVNSSGSPVTKIGCDNKQGNFTHPDDVFTLNNIKATVPGGGTSGWAEIAIPGDIANNNIKRVMIIYNKEMKCIGI